MRVHLNAIGKKNYDLCDTQHFKMITGIMTSNIIPGHIRSFGISYKF